MKKELGVIIPVYNESEIIKKTIDDITRVLTQLNLNFDIHIYNDGSLDIVINH